MFFFDMPVCSKTRRNKNTYLVYNTMGVLFCDVLPTQGRWIADRVFALQVFGKIWVRVGWISPQYEEGSGRKNRHCRPIVAIASMVRLGGGWRCTQFVRGRSRMAIDPRIPTVPGCGARRLFTDQAGISFTERKSAFRCSVCRVKGEPHPTKNPS